MTAQSPNTTMRMQYLASEIGFQLKTVDPVAATFTMIADKDCKTIHSTGVAASASDPRITSAT